jgi:NAD(P)H dehydrogenase (quinone)
MSKILRQCVLCLVLLPVLLPAQTNPRVLIVYYSQTGNTREMAEAVANGARTVAGVEVKLQTTAETTFPDLMAADAIIVGSPVYNANAAPEVMNFINSWPFNGAPFKDKIGAAFVTGGGVSAGEELVQLNILHSMMIFGMLVVGGADWTSPFGASAVIEEVPFDSTSDGKHVAKLFLRKGEGLGKRVAELCLRLKQSPQKNPKN